jgi:hypothetical protein
VQILEGSRVSSVWGSEGLPLERCTLRLDAGDHDLYASLVRAIQGASNPDDTILAIPNDAELYFLADRANPFRFYNSALGIRTNAELRHVTDEIAAHPPRLVIFRPDDKYNTDATRVVMDLVRARYEHFRDIDGLEIYRR